MSYSKKEYRWAAQSCIDSGEADVALNVFVKSGLVNVRHLNFESTKVEDLFYRALDKEPPVRQTEPSPAFPNNPNMPDGYKPWGARYRRTFIATGLASLALGSGGGAYFGAEEIGAGNQHIANNNHWAKVYQDRSCLRAESRLNIAGSVVKLASMTEPEKQACGFYFDNYSGRWTGHMLDGSNPNKDTVQTAQLPSADALRGNIETETTKAKDYSISESIYTGIAFGFFGAMVGMAGFIGGGYKVEMMRRKRAVRNNAESAIAVQGSYPMLANETVRK